MCLPKESHSGVGVEIKKLQKHGSADADDESF